MAKLILAHFSFEFLKVRLRSYGKVTHTIIFSFCGVDRATITSSELFAFVFYRSTLNSVRPFHEAQKINSVHLHLYPRDIPF